MKKTHCLILFISITLALLAPKTLLATSFASELLDEAPGVIDNFVPLSEGDPSVTPGFSSGDENPFTQDLSGQVSKGLAKEFVNAQNRTPLQLVTSIIRLFLAFLGIGAIIMMVYSGFRWMTSAGNEDAVKEAKATLRNAIIGLILIFMSYSLATFVGRRLQKDTASFGTGGTYGISTDGVEVGPVGIGR